MAQEEPGFQLSVCGVAPAKVSQPVPLTENASPAGTEAMVTATTDGGCTTASTTL